MDSFSRPPPRRTLFSGSVPAGNATDHGAIRLAYISGHYGVKEEYLAYSVQNFIADFGGYLGLLLGQSVVSFFDIGRRLSAKCAEACCLEKKIGK